ncbi:MAG: ribonuclease [Pseudomonadota bacterium]
MTDQPPEGEDAREAEAMGEKPDLGHKPDALIQALDGSDSGSDTRAGSLRGGSASGSSDDPDQDTINESLASEGMAMAAAASTPRADPDPVKNTGDLTGPSGDPAEGKRDGEDDDVDAATG